MSSQLCISKALPKIKEESEIGEVVEIFWQMTFQRKIAFFPNLQMPIMKNVSLMQINGEKKSGSFLYCITEGSPEGSSCYRHCLSAGGK